MYSFLWLFVFLTHRPACHPGGGGGGQDAGKTAGNHGQSLSLPPQNTGQTKEQLQQQTHSLRNDTGNRSSQPQSDFTTHLPLSEPLLQNWKTFTSDHMC